MVNNKSDIIKKNFFKDNNHLKYNDILNQLNQEPDKCVRNIFLIPDIIVI